MPSLENPIPKLLEAADAASKMISLQADLFLLNQELRAKRQIRRIIWTAVGLISFTLLLLFTFYWIQMGLYEAGWSTSALALLSIILFGVFTIISIFLVIRNSQESRFP